MLKVKHEVVFVVKCLMNIHDLPLS